MARKKNAEAEAPDVFQEVIDAQQVPVAEPVQENGHTNGHAKKVRHKIQPHSKASFSAGDLRVHYVDKGDNRAGIGIVAVTADGRKLTEEEKGIIREVMNAPTMTGRDSPFDWNTQFNPPMWHAEIGEDASSMKAVAIRLDGESRAKNLAAALKQHQADPVGYREMVQQRQEQSSERAL